MTDEGTFKMKEARTLRVGDVLVLPFGKTATVLRNLTFGRKFVSFTTEYGNTRIDLYEEVAVKL